MSAEQVLQAQLEGAAAVAALVGNRIAADFMAAGKPRPFVVYTRQATETHRALDGTVAARKITFEVQCWGDTRASAEACADACTDAIDAGDNGEIVHRTADDNPDLGLEVSILTVEWWE